MCQIFRDKLKNNNLLLGLQTNATLVDNEWIELFKKHNISIGVSVDGSKEIHDKYRVDHLGRGSYERTKKGISLLRDNFDDNIGALCVIDPQSSGKEAYRHLVHELKFKEMDFLIPDNHYENFDLQNIKALGNYLCEVFEAWIEEDDEKINIRFFSSLITRFLGKHSSFISSGPDRSDVAAITISSNGDLSPDDNLRSTSFDIIETGKSIYNTSLKEFLGIPIFKKLYNSKKILPLDCQDCIWQKVCAGGEPINRYKKENEFDNPSIYCSSLKKIYKTVTTHLLKNGQDPSKLANVLEF